MLGNFLAFELKRRVFCCALYLADPSCKLDSTDFMEKITYSSGNVEKPVRVKDREDTHIAKHVQRMLKTQSTASALPPQPSLEAVLSTKSFGPNPCTALGMNGLYFPGALWFQLSFACVVIFVTICMYL